MDLYCTQKNPVRMLKEKEDTTASSNQCLIQISDLDYNTRKQLEHSILLHVVQSSISMAQTRCIWICRS